MLAHPLHLKLLSGVTVLDDFKYDGVDGDLVGVVGDSWKLMADPVQVSWHSLNGVRDDGYDEIVSALVKDVEGLGAISNSSSYFYGKAIARAARLALIAEEVGYVDVIPAIQRFLRDSITPWLDGSFNGNGFLYDPKWGGIVTKLGSNDSGADFGFGIYNDHHYHLGYFLYAIAVLAKLDPAWGRKYRPQAYSMMADIMTLSRRGGSNYTRLRCFDLWKLHSWAGGLTEFADGRNQESTSEAVNAYYSAALMGLSFGDTHLVAIGSTLAALEIRAAETWWHVKEGERMYDEDFCRENRVDVRFVKDLVNWALPSLSREGVGEGWKGFVYAMEAIYDKATALEKTRELHGYDDGNSLSNLLWWIHSRGEEEGDFGWGKICWFSHYCH
ncbi:uncharacterized protein A4U43_C05F22990 [Asparagus officinalis]|uniref:glucan endo-1,3-beta-D-glucosidase n=1 Tax=Asparagus officinalis TaxID=4686 RepID=A0A5P1ETS9_ASPOF|nr:uncharacterized protein A4U43_C05F22990 [Asparagus officinalis]